ncbi:MAG: hypothetical protein GY710_19260 [Desulfobacteraceae bacterium]|nr:hypothetical protein [Desulfobacteraceae bacterium]
MISHKKTQDILPGKGHGIQSLQILALLILVISILGGCGKGLPDNIKKSAKALPNAIESAQKDIAKAQQRFTSFKNSKKFKPFAPYARKENWDQLFIKADQELERARTLNKDHLVPLLKKNKPEAASQVLAQIKRIRQVIQEVKQQISGFGKRLLRLKEAMDNTKDIHSKALAMGKKINLQVSNLKEGPVAKAKESFPDTTGKIDARFAPFLKIQQNVKARLDIINKEYQAHISKGNPDYAAFIDNADALSRDFKTLEQTQPAFKQDLNQLYESYTKILQDMKTKFYVTVKRESWNENSDYYDPRFVTFQRKVTPSVYEKLTESNQDTIAALSPGFNGLKFSNNIGDTWNKLKINPTEQWPSRNHNAASFWLENTKELYYHKYLKEKDGKTSETDWVQVNPSFYQQNLEFLGMAILSKPYGVFEQDRLAQATPPGLAYVGNSKYGEWKKDASGTSFWSWYGRYAFFSNLFFFPPSYFHYGSWNSWQNNYRYKKPYFGKTQNGNQKYGTRGSFVKRSPKYQSSTFSKTGGLKSQTASVRGGGTKLRGGGPKAKGK